MQHQRFPTLGLILIVFVTGFGLDADAAEPPTDPAVRRLPQDQPLLYHDADGNVQTAKTVEQWEARRREIAAGVDAVMGKPHANAKRIPLDVKVLEEVDCGSYVRRLITYASEPDSRAPAYLCIPKRLLQNDAAKAPAMLCLHPTDNTVGHKVVLGLGGRPNRQYGAELAERGYVTLSPSYPLLAQYQPDVIQLGWKSGTRKAVWDNMRGVDLLQSLPFVEGEKIGAIGHSLGGHNSVYTAFHDPRIKVVVSSCGLDSFLDYYDGAERVWMPEKGWTQTRYMPRLREYRGKLKTIPFDFHELLASIAPRPVLIIAPLHDSNFKADSVDRVAAAAAKVYALHDAGSKLKVLHPDCAHDFPPEMREAAYRWIDGALKK